jgi:Tol biopolymer transport system component
MTDSARDSITDETPLESWKEIAAYVQRDVRTAKRWEKSEGLPVHRHHHLSRSSVYAYPSELEAWRVNRKPTAESAPSTWWRPAPAFASTGVLAMALMMAGGGPHVGAPVQAADGIVTRLVWSGADAGGESISPDGRYLAFADYQNRAGDVAVRNLGTGEIRYLTSEASDDSLAGTAVFSPDGQRIVYGWYDSNILRELRIVNRDGTGGRILRRGDGKMSILLRNWSADGKRILALRREANPRNTRETINEIVSIPASDGSLQVLKTLDWRFGKMAFSPDGKHIAYDFPAKMTPSTHDIFLLSSDGSNESALVEHPAFDYVVDWSPDGKSLFFASDRTGDWALWRVSVAEWRAQGPPELVKRHVGMITGIGVTSSGALYYKLGGRSSDVYAAALDAIKGKAIGTPRPLVERFMGSNAWPEWAPDGKRLAYISRRYPPPQTSFLCIRDLETGTDRDLRPDLFWFQDLQWFPDGRSILAYGVGPEDGTLGYFRIDTQSGAASLLFEIEFRGMTPYAALSPDGRQVYYKRVKDEQAPERIVVRDLVSGQERVIGRAPDNSEFVELAVSPDGTLLATKLNWRGKAPFALVVVPTAGGELREVTNIPAPHWFQNIAWTPDSRYLLFTKHDWKETRLDRVELWRVAVGSGKEEPAGLPLEGMRDLCVHPTGSRIAYTLARSLTEVWAIENVLPVSRAAK